MGKAEDLLYEGIREDALDKRNLLLDLGCKYQYMEFGDRLAIALSNIRENTKINENI